MNKNYIKIPKAIKIKIDRFHSNEIEVVSVVSYTKEAIKMGETEKFGVKYDSERLVVEKYFRPPNASGKYSFKNNNKYVVKRVDLPMIKKSYSFESPNFGDWDKGSHTVSWDKDVYQRETVEPRNLDINVFLLSERDSKVVLGFKVNCILNKESESFEKDLLFCINLLQENVGYVDVVEAGSKLEEKHSYSRLNWEVLPQGWWKDVDFVRGLKQKLGNQESKFFFDRNEFMEELGPIESYVGQSYLGNRLYFVYVFDKAVVAECPKFGNAIYVLKDKLKDSWKEILSTNKRLALSNGAVRILHMGNWKIRLKNELTIRNNHE